MAESSPRMWTATVSVESADRAPFGKTVEPNGSNPSSSSSRFPAVPPSSPSRAKQIFGWSGQPD